MFLMAPTVLQAAGWSPALPAHSPALLRMGLLGEGNKGHEIPLRFNFQEGMEGENSKKRFFSASPRAPPQTQAKRLLHGEMGCTSKGKTQTGLQLFPLVTLEGRMGRETASAPAPAAHPNPSAPSGDHSPRGAASWGEKCLWGQEGCSHGALCTPSTELCSAPPGLPAQQHVSHRFLLAA